MRYRRLSLALLALLAAAMLGGLSARPAAAQAARRWVADPSLLTQVKMIGPGGGQTVDTVGSIDLLSATDGWASSYGSLLRFDGRYWRRQIQLGPTTFAAQVDFATPTEGWVVGREHSRNPPYDPSVLLARIDVRTNALTAAPVTRRDGTAGPIAGGLNAIAAFPGAAMAVGGTPIEGQWQAPLVLRYDGAGWRDVTPPEWRLGYLSGLSMVSPSEGWATGLFGRPGGQGADAVRPVIVHYRDGAWTEEPLPALPISGQPFSMGQIVMKDAGEGWAVFRDAGTRCANARLLYFHGGTWIVPEQPYASGIALGLRPGTGQGWVSLFGCQAGSSPTPDRRMRFDSGTLTPDAGGAALVPSVYGLLSEGVQWAASGGSMMRYTADAMPTDRVGAKAGARYFPETGHTLAGDFRAYYESHGLELGDRGVTARESLALFGYPVSEPFDELNPETGELLRVQYFERARFELHPENRPPYRVLLGRLGYSTRMALTGSVQVPAQDPGPGGAGCQRFAETGYDLCPPLRSFWERSGGLPVFGFPIVRAQDEQSATDGKSYLTQWLERERLEHHPELRGTPYEVLLGLLGSEELRRRGMLP